MACDSLVMELPGVKRGYMSEVVLEIVKECAKMAAPRIKDAFVKLAGQYGEKGAAHLESAKEYATAGVEALKETAGELWEGGKGTVRDTYEDITEWGKGLLDF